jgi:hypothetical protein
MKIPTIDLTPAKRKDSLADHWWQEDSDTVHNHVWSMVTKLEDQARERQLDDQRNARLVSNRQFLSLNIPSVAGRSTNRPTQDTARLTLNVIKSCVDTAAAKISKSKPRPQFVTSGGDHKLKKKAKQLTKYLDGLFDSARVYPTAQEVFVDACTFGTGVLKVFIKDEECIAVERVLPQEILVDEAESYYSNPRQLHHRKFISRTLLASMFPEHKDLIATAASTVVANDVSQEDLVTVVESWHLPSSKQAQDGRRVICVSNVTLVDEPWVHDFFPFAFFRWSKLPVGFFGQGLAEELTGIQIEINKILRNIQSAQAVMSVPRVFLDSPANVPSAKLQPNPEGLSVVYYQGSQPTFLTAPAMPGEVYSHLDRLVNKAYEITGISQLSASSKKPGGLDSGVAIREFQDIESERFILVGQRWEQLFLDVASIAIELSKALYEINPQLNVTIATRSVMEKIKWKDVDMDQDKYVMRCFPTSILPTTPAGRLQAVQEMIQAGFVSKEEGMNLLDFPDLERANSINNAAVDDVMSILEKIVDEGEYTTPEPYFDLKLCIRLAQGMYLRSRNNAVPEERLELLRRFIDDCNFLSTPPAPPAALPAPAPQLAVPEAPPTSDLLPLPAAPA